MDRRSSTPGVGMVIVTVFACLGHGSLTYADGHLIVLGDRGTLALVEAKSDAYRERSRTQVFDTKTWTVPTFVGGRLYLRDQNELVSLHVAR